MVNFPNFATLELVRVATFAAQKQGIQVDRVACGDLSVKCVIDNQGERWIPEDNILSPDLSFIAATQIGGYEGAYDWED
ncbi:MAG: hypothetical protein HC878_00095 [Leptolyngbyaceae cyanobacterium SL_5_14]|nr:hypothetical protein [Leptolyngbyaceae cyanobacterium SL_5_14]